MIHPTAVVETEHIDASSNVWAFAHIMPGAHIGANVNIGDHAFIESGAVVGNNVTLKNRVSVWRGITIEDDVFVGPAVTFTNDRQPRSPRMPQARERYATPDNWLVPTHVSRGCSIGAAATIVAGCDLGAYSMIGAGAVVTHPVPPFALVLGCPARHVADVCRCGQRLGGPWHLTACDHCGETPEQRQQWLPLTEKANP